jgi:N utilization substance protein A
VDTAVSEALVAAGIEYIEDFINAEEERLAGIENISPEALVTLRKLIEEYVEVVEENAGETEEPVEDTPEAGESEPEIEEYECPECGGKITLDMTICPTCGVGLSFEYE